MPVWSYGALPVVPDAGAYTFENVEPIAVMCCPCGRHPDVDGDGVRCHCGRRPTAIGRNSAMKNPQLPRSSATRSIAVALSWRPWRAATVNCTALRDYLPTGCAVLVSTLPSSLFHASVRTGRRAAGSVAPFGFRTSIGLSHFGQVGFRVHCRSPSVMGCPLMV
jgi:hypothetical protein